MQIVTLDELKLLAQGSQLSEDSNDNLGYDFSFKDVEKLYKKKKAELRSSLGDSYDKEWRRNLHDWLKNRYLREKCPPIKLVGAGSSRTSYACLGGKCLKVAISEAGAAQNKQEQKHTQKKHWWTTTYRCFAQTYDANDDYGLLLTECCAHIEDLDQFTKAFNMKDYDVFRAIVSMVGKTEKHDVATLSNSLKQQAKKLQQDGKDFPTMMRYADSAMEASKWLDNLIYTPKSQMDPGQKSFFSLITFWQKNGKDELLPGDVINDENWGFAIRDGVVAPVILDSGFSKAIADKYYKT